MAPFLNLDAMRLAHRRPAYTSYNHASVLRRQQNTATATSASRPTASSVEGLSADDFIRQAENHWDVSATSILAAWVATMIGVILILLLYSCVRLKWRRIYLPRLKLRKPGNTEYEKAEKKTLEDKYRNDQSSLRETLGNLMKKRYEEEPDYFPGFIRNDSGKWQEVECNGRWTGKAPKAPITFFGWIRPNWEETKVEIMAIIPKWFCCCWSFIGVRWFVTDRGERKRMTILDQDIKSLKMIDAVIYLMYLRLLKYLFLAISIFATMLAFANYYINTETIYGSTNALFTNPKMTNSTNDDHSSHKNGGNITNIIENPNLLTAANITSNGLIVHISFEILVTMLVIIFVWKASKHHHRLVKEWEHMNRNEISFKTLFITNLCIKEPRIDKAKKKITDLVVGDKADTIESEVWFAVHPLNALEKQIEKFKKKYFSKAITAVAMETFYEVQGSKNHYYDSCWDRFLGRTKSAKTKVDEALIEKRRIERTQAKIRGEEDSPYKQHHNATITAAFISFPTARQAKAVLMDRRLELSKAGYKLQKAPRTHNVLWRNLEQDAKSRKSHKTFGRLALVLVCFLNTIPVMGIVLLTNLGIAIDRYPSLAKKQEESQFWKVIFMVIEGVLPATVAAIFSYFLPYIMRELNRWSGSITRGQLDKDQIRQVFIFLLVSNFVVFALIGVLYETISGIYTKIGEDSIGDIYKSLGDLPAKITRAYISQSLYWFSWYPIRSIVMWLQLLQVPRLLMKTPQLLKFKTPHDLAEVTLAIHFEIFAMSVGLIYAPLAPIVVIGATLHFWSAHIVHSQALKYVNDAKETDGECWWVIINRLLVGTVLMQCLMVLTVTLKTRSPWMAVITALPIILIVLFKLYLKKHYDQDNQYHVPAHSNDFFEEEKDSHKLKDADYLLDKYEPDVLRRDWMPTGKAISKNRRLKQRAIKHVQNIGQLIEDWNQDERKGRRIRRKTG
ncbi:uncharacterized protein I303_103924 [Kwoniella dejecticola CBS 10117]|uniref:CSC1/OSCA1-like 7TM region domain-containing protein n=1 Tax=Kwoniella dejecticola CBS 10117 TaxID=1296121 RepID=A0AAJ8MHC9_9TREE